MNKTETNVIDYIWYSQKQHFKAHRYQPLGVGKDGKYPQGLIDAMNRDSQQLLVPPELFPSDLYLDEHHELYKEITRHIFTVGFTVVSARCAAVLKDFDLGSAGLHPVRLWRADQKTRVPGEFFYFNHGNRKTGFLPDRSPKARKEESVWKPTPIPVNDELVFGPAALGGVDIWRDDLTYWGFLLSNRLALALKAAGVAQDWLLLRCPVIEA